MTDLRSAVFNRMWSFPDDQIEPARTFIAALEAAGLIVLADNRATRSPQQVGHPRTVPTMADPRVEIVARVINDNGGQPGNSIHGWRCQYPDQYGKCDCVEQTAREILAALDPATYTHDGVRRDKAIRPRGDT